MNTKKMTIVLIGGGSSVELSPQNFLLWINFRQQNGKRVFLVQKNIFVTKPIFLEKRISRCYLADENKGIVFYLPKSKPQHIFSSANLKTVFFLIFECSSPIFSTKIIKPIKFSWNCDVSHLILLVSDTEIWDNFIKNSCFQIVFLKSTPKSKYYLYT